MEHNITTEPAASSSSPSTHQRKYDVFLSFRDADTRVSVVDPLYSSLLSRGIDTFWDDDLLKKEGDIPRKIFEAIEKSRISVVIFSKKYASSTWCLDELAKIIECKNSQQQIVLPIYSDVDALDVRKQTGTFGEAFVEHEDRFKDDLNKVTGWRSALTEATDLSGWDLNKNRRESKFIHEITEMILQKLNRAYLTYETDYLVGIDSRIREMNHLLGVGAADVRMVGILGNGGMGKTTLATAVYNSVAHKFEGSCFLGKVREKSKQLGGLVKLQKTLLHDILGVKISSLTDADSGVDIIKRRLHDKRVLLIIDDVDDLDQLKYLAGSSDWFGAGSRIIITTRYEHLFRSHKVDFRYQVKELEPDDAMELFHSKAFPTSRIPNDYLEPASRVVGYAQGNPLALIDVGSFLCGKSIFKWQPIFEWYKRAPQNIQEIVKIIKKEDERREREREEAEKLERLERLRKLLKDKEDLTGLDEFGSLKMPEADKSEADDVDGTKATKTKKGSPGGDENSPASQKKDQVVDVTSTANVRLSERRIELSNNMDYNITAEPAASSSSPSTHQWKYGVFLSFIGDTRVSFASHLYDSLVNRGINTFMDDYELRRGESRISVVVFSESYASSGWCLDDLVKILECKKSQQQIVLPIYYDVDPSHVRHQTGTFGEAFHGLAYKYKDDEEKVMRWKMALTEAGNLSAMVFNKDWSESKFIHEITEEISRLLKRAYLTYETNYPVGIDSRIREMNYLARHRLNEAESPEKVLEDEEDQRGPNEVGSPEMPEAHDVDGVPETNEGSPGGEETSPENQNKDQVPDVTEPGEPEPPGEPADNDTGDPKGFSDWIFLIISIILEILSAICDQFSSSEKPKFAVIGMVLAILALVICVSELIYKGRKRKFEFGRCRMFFCPKRYRLFGTLPDLFGLISGISQCASSIVQCVCVLRRKDNPFKVNLLPIILLICVGGSKLFEDCKRCTKYSGSRSPGREIQAESQDSGERTTSSNWTSVSGSVEGGTASVSSNLSTQSSIIQTVGNSNQISVEGPFESSGDEKPFSASEINVELETFYSRGKIGS